MPFIWKALKWAYGDSLRYIGFMLAVAAVASFAIVFLSYPLQTVFSLIAIFVVVTLFLFFHELGR